MSTIVKVRNGFDQLLTWLKWPTGIIALVCLPGSVLAILGLLGEILGDIRPMIPFILGAGIWIALWWNLWRRSRFTFFLTLEHELTHAIFAWLTFHRVTGLKVTVTRGGQMSYVGKGNWLISIAPYFFPTVSVIIIASFCLLPFELPYLPGFMLGLSFAWNITSTMKETHGGQTDLQKVGKMFAAMFLPTANAVSIGSVLSFAHGGFSGWMSYLTAVIGKTSSLLGIAG